jgi:hypothetical protein
MDTKHIVTQWPKTRDEALVGSKYGDDTLIVDEWVDGRSVNRMESIAGERHMHSDAKINAAKYLVSLEVLKEVVEAQRDVDVAYGRAVTGDNSFESSQACILASRKLKQALALANDWITKQQEGK